MGEKGGSPESRMTNVSDLPDFCTKPVLVLGCGNRLFGDDGFGCEVAEYLQTHYRLPDDVYVMDVGTSARKLLFTLCLSPERPRQIILVDAVDKGRMPGEIFELSLDDLPVEKRSDFSLHQVPSSNLAKELKEAGVDVRVIVCQVGRVPESVEPGLSEPVAQAVPRVAAEIARRLSAVFQEPSVQAEDLLEAQGKHPDSSDLAGEEPTMVKEKKVYLPRWIAWMIAVIMLPVWGWLTYATFGGQAAGERPSLGEWAVISIVILGALVMVFLMSYGKLPAYIIREEDE